MTSHLNLHEVDVIKLVLEFLESRNLHIAQMALESETGVINTNLTENALYFRQLVLDGQWDTIFDFLEPLEKIPGFRRVKFHLLKQKFLEHFCLFRECANNVSDVLELFNELGEYATDKEHKELDMLMTNHRHLEEHDNYLDWNPIAYRLNCFNSVYTIVKPFLAESRKESPEFKWAQNDRLMQVLTKGILYESCVNYCQGRATGSKDSQSMEMKFPHLLDASNLSKSEPSLRSWLQSIPEESFSIPFEQSTLKVDIERLEKPVLNVSWPEYMMMVPARPNVFPYTSVMFTRPHTNSGLVLKRVHDDYSPNMAHSAGFRLCDDNCHPMAASVDRLFSNYETLLNHSSPDIGEVLSSPVTPNPNHSPFSAFQQEAGLTPLSPSQKANSEKNEAKNQVEKSDKMGKPENSVNKSLSQSIPPFVTGFTPRPGSQTKLVAKPTLPSSSLTKPTLLPKENPKPLVTCTMSKPTTTSVISKPTFGTSVPPSKAMFVSNIPVGKENYGINAPAPEYRTDKPQALAEITPTKNGRQPSPQDESPVKFIAVSTLEDSQAIRCAEFHPSGRFYAVGSNSKTLRICAYPDTTKIREDHTPFQPTVIFKRTKHHKGSLYCLAWSPAGDLLATGSNDKVVKLMRFNEDNVNLENQGETELSMHDGTIRDLTFVEDSINKASLLISAGAGDYKIYITDCATGDQFQALSGHSGTVLALCSWGGALFASGSSDRTVRLWDLRTRDCSSSFTPPTVIGTRGSPVGSVCVEPSGRLLVSGHEDGSCVLYDIRGGRMLQRINPHAQDVRSVRFSPAAYYLLTASYDSKVALTDLQGDLTLHLPNVPVCRHFDKVISGRWHPKDFVFLSTSADRTAILWALPPV